MKPLWKTGIILSAIAVLGSIAIGIFHSINRSSIALSEEWIVIEVIDGESMTVRQTNGKQMQVRLCGIDVVESSNEAREKLRSLVATNDGQVMIIPVAKDEQGRTVAEVMTYGKGDVEISFQEELLKNGLARMQQGGVECPNLSAFENAQRMALTSKAGIWGQLK